MVILTLLTVESVISAEKSKDSNTVVVTFSGNFGIWMEKSSHKIYVKYFSMKSIQGNPYFGTPKGGRDKNLVVVCDQVSVIEWKETE